MCGVSFGFGTRASTPAGAGLPLSCPILPPVFGAANRTRTVWPLPFLYVSHACVFIGRLADRFLRSKTLALWQSLSKVPLGVSGHRTGAAVDRNNSVRGQHTSPGRSCWQGRDAQVHVGLV